MSFNGGPIAGVRFPTRPFAVLETRQGSLNLREGVGGWHPSRPTISEERVVGSWARTGFGAITLQGLPSRTWQPGVPRGPVAPVVARKTGLGIVSGLGMVIRICEVSGSEGGKHVSVS